MPIENQPQNFFFSGKENMEQSVNPSGAFKLVFVRVHFSDQVVGGGAATTKANLSMALVANEGEAHDVELYTYKNRGIGADANLVFEKLDSQNPSPWSFVAGDRLLFQWTNPGDVTWGLSVGFVRTDQ